jgi:hypothetical protein
MTPTAPSRSALRTYDTAARVTTSHVSPLASRPHLVASKSMSVFDNCNAPGHSLLDALKVDFASIVGKHHLCLDATIARIAATYHSVVRITSAQTHFFFTSKLADFPSYLCSYNRTNIDFDIQKDIECRLRNKHNTKKTRLQASPVCFVRNGSPNASCSTC